MKQQDQDIEEGQQIDSQKQSSQFIMSKSAGRTNICCICRSKLAKYTCPKCKDKTCSLQCNKKHKSLKSCSGITSAIQYVPSSEIKQEVVRKDYNYMQDMIQSTDKVKKCLTGVTNSALQPKRFKILRNNAKRMYNVNVKHAPSIIERHRENISFYYMKTKQFYWVYEILFFIDNKHSSRLLTTPLPDSKQLKQILEISNYFCAQLMLKGINTLKFQQFKPMIQNCQSSKQHKKYIQICLQKSMHQNIRNITINEFPTIILVHNSLQKQFQKTNQI